MKWHHRLPKSEASFRKRPLGRFALWANVFALLRLKYVGSSWLNDMSLFEFHSWTWSANGFSAETKLLVWNTGHAWYGNHDMACCYRRSRRRVLTKTSFLYYIAPAWLFVCKLQNICCDATRAANLRQFSYLLQSSASSAMLPSSRNVVVRDIYCIEHHASSFYGANCCEGEHRIGTWCEIITSDKHRQRTYRPTMKHLYHGLRWMPCLGSHVGVAENVYTPSKFVAGTVHSKAWETVSTKWSQ